MTLNCNTIKEGQLDPLNRMVTKVYYSDQEYAIYDVSNSDSLCYISENVQNELSDISLEIDEVQHLISKDKILEYKHRFAKAYKECYEGNLENAKKILKSIETSYQQEKKDLINFKYAYILTATIAFFLNIVISIFLFDFNLKLTETIQDLFYVATFGSLGGLISISISLKKINIDIPVGFRFYIFDAFFRIIISMASAIAMYYMIRANIILGFAYSSEDYTSELVFIFAIVAGFSEYFVSNLFGLIEEKTTIG